LTARTGKKTTKKEVVTAFRTREILSAAREVLERRGVEAATMEEIAAAAGVAKGTLYLYFRGKEDLIHALMSEVGEKMLRELRAIVEAPQSPRGKLTQVLALLLNYLERERILFPVYMRDLTQWMLQGGRRSFRRILELEEQVLSQISLLFAEGAAQGEFISADPRLLTFLLRGMVRALGYYRMVEGHRVDMRQALSVLSVVVVSGFTTKADSAPEGQS
jgi:AcrR family transcriptional regulator